MKKILLSVLVCASAVTFAQKKVTSNTSYYYSDAVTLDYIDSNVYTYSSWDGSLTSNEPKFGVRNDDVLLFWFWEEPTIGYTSKDNWGNNSHPLLFGYNSTKTYNASYQCTEELTSSFAKKLYTYTASGKVATVTNQDFTGVWETSDVQTYEYDVQDRMVRRLHDDYSSGSAVQIQRDTLEYQGTTNDITRGIIYSSNDGVIFNPEVEVIYTWSSGKPATLKYYEDNDGDPMTPLDWLFQGQYVHTGSVLNSLDVYPIISGVPGPSMIGQFALTYTVGGKLETETATGFDERITTYIYDTDGFVTTIEEQVDYGSGMFLTQAQKFYYQNTATIAENTIEISIFPVPANDILSIQTSASINAVKVYSLEGKLLSHQIGSFNSIDVTNLNPGEYILVVSTDKANSSVKFIKK